jgi:hypothetical protein
LEPALDHRCVANLELGGQIAGALPRVGDRVGMSRSSGNAPPLTDPTTGLVFPDLSADGERLRSNLIVPEPTIFLRRKFPICSIIRRMQTKGAAMGAAQGLTANGLFVGQSPEFFAALNGLVQAADAAERQPSCLAVTPYRTRARSGRASTSACAPHRLEASM